MINDNLGWIQLHRKSIEHPLFKKPLIWHYWNYCLLKSNHQDAKIIWNCSEMEVKRGSFISGLKEEAKATGLSIQNLRTSRKTLVNLKMIEISTVQSTGQFSVITICNYDNYQSLKKEANTPSNTPPTDHQQTANRPPTTNNNDNNNNNENNNSIKDGQQADLFDLSEIPVKEDFTKDFNYFWSKYPRKVSKAVAKKSFLKLAKKHSPKIIIDGLFRYLHFKIFPEDKILIPHASTWLNQERFLDTVDDLRDVSTKKKKLEF